MHDSNDDKDIVDEILSERIGTKERGEEISEIADAEISRLCDAVGLDESTQQVASAIYKQVLKTQVIQNRTLREVCAGVVYTAVRSEKKPINIAQISGCSPLYERDIKRAFADISKQTDIDVGLVEPETFISQYCSALGLSDSVEERAESVIDISKEANLHSGVSPSGFAAASVYLSALLEDERKTQREAADVAAIGVKTIRNQYQKQLEYLAESDEFKE